MSGLSKQQKFPSRCRLHKPAEFRAVFNSPQKVTDSPIAIYWRKNQMMYPRLGLVVAKKNIRSAVNRNRIKRVFRECFRQQSHVLNGHDIIMVAYKGTEAIDDRRELHVLVKKLWEKFQRQCAKSAFNS